MCVVRKYVPFQAYVLDDPDVFYGRDEEIIKILNILEDVRTGMVHKHLYIYGEVGIGKSSLVKQIELISRGDNRILKRLGFSDRCGFNFIVCKIILDGNKRLNEVIDDITRIIKQRTYPRLLNILNSIEHINSTIKLGNIGNIFETTFSISMNNRPISMNNRLLEVLSKTSDNIHRLCKDGLILIIEGLDGISDLHNKQLFFKTLCEQMNNDKITNICFIITSDKQIQDEGIYFEGFFDCLKLKPLDKKAVELHLRSTLDKVKHTISQEVIDAIYDCSQGIPMQVRLISREVYLADTDNYIDINDFKKGYQEYLRQHGKKSKRDIERC